MGSIMYPVTRYTVFLYVFWLVEEKISDHQQSWGCEDGPWKGPRPPLLGAADFYCITRLTVATDFLLARSQ